MSQGSDQLDSRFTLIRFWKSNQPMIRKWVNHDSPTLNFWFDLIFYSWIMIRGWIAIRDESKSNWIANQNESMRFVRFESESKRIRIKNRMIHLSESQIKKKILIHLANQNLFVIFDSLRRIKNSRIKLIDSVRALLWV